MEGTGALPPRLAPVPALPVEDVIATEADPIQLALVGTHLVPATPRREEPEALSTVSEDGAALSVPASQAAAFFETFQDERGKTFRGVPRESMPAAWADWYRQALPKVGGDEGRLLAACRGYLQSDWGRSRQPAGTALAFCTPKVWGRYVPPLQHEAPAESGPPSVDASTEAGRLWKACLTWLYENGKRYALTWLDKAQAVEVEDGHLLLAVPDLYFRQWVEEHYGEMVSAVAREFGLQGVRWVLPTETRQQATGSTR